MRCIGYGEFEKKCNNTANKKTSPSGYWCQRCEQIRRDTITKSLQDFVGGTNK
jgi:hypothetical protein